MKNKNKKKRDKKDITGINELKSQFKAIFRFEDPTDKHNFKDILDAVSKKMDVKAYKDNYFRRRVHAMMRRLKITTYRDFANALKENPQLIDQLVKNLSINVTSFFRNRETYLFIRDHVLADLLDSKPTTKTINIWSAGCASGAEPYTIAILISEYFPKAKTRINILGTDLNSNLLDLARNGHYREEEIVEVPNTILTKYFKKNPITHPRIYHLDPSIKRMVTFKQHDLTTPPPIKNVDLILCRNVMIYFSQEQNQKVYQYFQQALKPGGFVVIGQSEILPFNLRNRFMILNRKHRVFKYTP